LKAWLLLAGLLAATPGWAQAPLVPVTAAEGAILRGLDTANGQIQDIEIAVGATARFERLEITLRECRYPSENPASDAFAYVIIRDIREAQPRFEGWMIAASPALSALDHPRYDVWVLRCQIPATGAESKE
jgi:hypothetical protein